MWPWLGCGCCRWEGSLEDVALCVVPGPLLWSPVSPGFPPFVWGREGLPGFRARLGPGAPCPRTSPGGVAGGLLPTQHCHEVLEVLPCVGMVAPFHSCHAVKMGADAQYVRELFHAVPGGVPPWLWLLQQERPDSFNAQVSLSLSLCAVASRGSEPSGGTDFGALIDHSVLSLSLSFFLSFCRA